MKDWKTTLTGIGVAFMSALAMLAALPYTLGDVATIVPTEWKATVVKVSLIAAFLLRLINAFVQKDKEPPKLP